MALNEETYNPDPKLQMLQRPLWGHEQNSGTWPSSHLETDYVDAAGPPISSLSRPKGPPQTMGMLLPHPWVSCPPPHPGHYWISDLFGMADCLLKRHSATQRHEPCRQPSSDREAGAILEQLPFLAPIPQTAPGLGEATQPAIARGGLLCSSATPTSRPCGCCPPEASTSLQQPP